LNLLRKSKWLPESDIGKGSAHFFIGHGKRFLHAGIHQLCVGVGTSKIMIFQVYFQLVLEDEWQPMFHKATDFPSMLAMAIAHREKVAVAQT